MRQREGPIEQGSGSERASYVRTREPELVTVSRVVGGSGQPRPFGTKWFAQRSGDRPARTSVREDLELSAPGDGYRTPECPFYLPDTRGLDNEHVEGPWVLRGQLSRQLWKTESEM